MRIAGCELIAFLIAINCYILTITEELESIIMGQDFSPSISVVIPTLNSSSTLNDCLSSIRSQNYSGDVEVIVVDGGSVDGTAEIARDFGCTLIYNPLKTGEAGKAAGLRYSKGELIALIDSDNILPDSNWFHRMVKPFQNREIVASEPVWYTYRRTDLLLTRYCALMGMGDPLCYFIGNYDRYCTLSGKWTGLNVVSVDKGDYFLVELKPGNVPTMGANGFIIRKETLDRFSFGDYLFDSDLVQNLVESGERKFAKVKTGIVHLYGRGLMTFARKQLRRIRDFMYYNSMGMRTYPWLSSSKAGVAKFILYCLLFFPLVLQALKGFIRKRDVAWVLHVPACIITLFVYAFGYIEGRVRPRIQDRRNWRQV